MPVNYQLGKIYTIVNDLNDIIYVGATAQKLLCNRWACHRQKSKDRTSGIYTAMRTLGMDHFRIVLHHAFPCQSKDELYGEEMRTMDLLIASGKSVYNTMIGGKHSDATNTKNAEANKGNTYAFAFGCNVRTPVKGGGKWVLVWYEGDKQRSKSFSCQKYGEYGAHWRSEEFRKQIYPEFGTEEDCTCDDFGAIEWN